MVGYFRMPRKVNSVVGIINFMRNIGCSIGTSLVTTLSAGRKNDPSLAGEWLLVNETIWEVVE
jgi:hypothetical protein